MAANHAQHGNNAQRSGAAASPSRRGSRRHMTGVAPSTKPANTRIPSPLDDDSPRPISVDPTQTGSFSLLGKGQGARITNRDNAELARQAQTQTPLSSRRRLSRSARPKVKSHQTKTHGDHKLYILLGVLAAIVILLAVVLLRAAFAPNPAAKKNVQQTQAAVGETLKHDGAAYALREQADGSYALTYLAKGADAEQTLCTLSGQPIGLYFFDGSLIIPENTKAGWDVLAYMRGVNTEPVPVTADKKPVGGKGSLVSAELNDSTLTVSTKDGTTTKVELS